MPVDIVIGFTAEDFESYRRERFLMQVANGDPAAVRTFRLEFYAAMRDLKLRSDKLGADIEAFAAKRSGQPVLGL